MFQVALAAVVAVQASPIDTKKAVAEAKAPQPAAEAVTADNKRNKKRYVTTGMHSGQIRLSVWLFAETHSANYR